MDKTFVDFSGLLLSLKGDFTSCLTCLMIAIPQSASQKLNIDKCARKLLKISWKTFQIILACKQTN